MIEGGREGGREEVSQKEKKGGGAGAYFGSTANMAAACVLGPTGLRVHFFTCTQK